VSTRISSKVAAPRKGVAIKGIDLGFWRVDTFWEAVILTIIGIPLAFISLHLMNGAAFIQGRLARVMLGPIGQTEVAVD